MTVNQIENEEIEISNELQEIINLKDGDKLIIKKVKGRVVMKKNLAVKDLLDLPILCKMSLKEIENELITLNEKLDNNL